MIIYAWGKTVAPEITCPVCDNTLDTAQAGGDRLYYGCPRCGRYCLTGTARAILPDLLPLAQGWAKLSHALRKMERRGRDDCLSSEALKSLVQNSRPPSAKEQLNNFIEWLGTTQEEPGTSLPLGLDTIGSTGAASPEGMRFIVKHAIHAGLISGEGVADFLEGIGGEASLTLAGWSYFEELQRGRVDSTTAFMAMKFGDTQLDALYADYLKKAVEDTGFKLKKLDEGQPAGLIDDRLRVEIQQARFLIADLTHNNNGAYWEAGYAEGLGKPVIYMCRMDVFNDRDSRPHFDTNHHLTVVWSPGEEAAAVQKLKDTIRATLPGEAVITDPGDA